MAAPPSKPSPSNRPMDETTAADSAASAAKEEPVVTTPVDSTNAAPTSPATESSPTYQSVEASDIFLLAKSHLNEGKFEDALSVIEQGIKGTQELLKRTTNFNDEEITIHEAIAPYHYLYGTTLLYSIEESDQEVTTAGSAVSAAVVSGDGAPATASVAPEDPPAEGGQGPSATDVDEDMQIAWENFEAARSIMESMMVKPQSNGDLTEMLSLDLAQIYLREGDLQRMNGRNEAAIQDYQSCLRLRKQSKFLDKWDRKLADVHYQLGLVYINFASKDDDDEDGANTDGKKVEDEKAKEAKRIVARNKSVYHFLECSKCFCGQIASICNADPGSVIKIQPGDLDNEANEDKTPKFKTTGEEDEEMELPKVASSKLSTMRKRVTALIASADLTTEQREKVNDLSQLLEDIQETVDEAENSTKGVQQVSNMKAEVAALAAADGDIEPLSEGNSTTTIGFGAATTTTAASAATTSSASAFASANVAAAAAAAPPAAARPMMVVKKKKRAALQTVQEPESKKPKPEAE